MARRYDASPNAAISSTYAGSNCSALTNRDS